MSATSSSTPCRLPGPPWREAAILDATTGRAPDPTRNAAAADGSAAAPPRALVVGLPAFTALTALEDALEVERVAPSEAALLAPERDVLLLDGALPAEELRTVLHALESSGARRPAVLLIVPGGVVEVEGLLTGEADEAVAAPLGAQELLARIRGALKVRSVVAELTRKNLELEACMERMTHRMNEELRLASNVQRSLMPPPLQHQRLEFAREFLPFREIGGDYYDLLPLGRDRLAFAIGDVMGKGVAAALLAANLKACLRAHLQSGETPPEDLVARVNRLFWEATPRGLFASLFFGVFDLERGRLGYVNAGHDHPFRVAPDGTVQDLGLGGTVLGLLEEARYERGEIAVGRDDVIVFYSDGVTDRSSRDGELFGVERLKEAAVRSRGDAARIALYTLLGEVQGWSGGTPAEDDMTLIVVKVR